MEFNENQAIYLQIADYFCENIIQRKWQKGEKIPSIREIAVKVEVNPNTAMRTYNYLQEKGIIFNKRGIGYFVTDDGYGKTLELKKEQFINEDLPQMFRLFDLLQFSFDDLKKYYDDYKKTQSN
jgi:GntR family transcriptional regulator